ncbi:MAG: hypothetical protein K2F57_01990 [Candidatus Gastranaerophilales bacterium]|nr:hypothetical protein [Candidatus Gastranaerophilales bacterium]
MVNIISDSGYINRGSNSSFVTLMLDRPQRSQAVVPKKENSVKKYAIPAGLLAGGSVLLYLGLSKPGKNKLFNTHIKNQIFNMEKKVHEFTAFVRNSVEDIAGESSAYVNNYRAAHFINPVEYSSQLKVFRRPEKVAEAQDISFEAIANRTDFGMDDIKEFSSMFGKVKGSTEEKIIDKKNLIRASMSDNVHISLPKINRYVDLVEEGENHLITMQNALSLQLNNIQKMRLQTAVRYHHGQMAQSITESRRLQHLAKENLINTSFYQVKKLLNLPEDFGPSYVKIPQISDFDGRLAAMDLKPVNVPPRLREIYDDNYFRAALERDFTDLSEKDVREIFYSSSPDNNLRDLGYLIDRLRLRQAIFKAKNNDKKSVYDVLVPKLEYLSARLHEFGKRDLLIRCSADFDSMNVPKRRVALEQIYNTASRIGYESIAHMDSVLAKESPNYRTLNIRNYMKIFKDNPDIYFF